MPETPAQPLLFRALVRKASLIINAAFAVILFSIMVNEDAPREAAMPTIYLLLLAMISSFVAWRWEKTGIIMTAIAAAGLSVAVYISAQAVGAVGLASFSFLAAGLNGLPFMLLSALFFASHRLK